MAQGKVTKRTVDALKKGARDQFLWDDEDRGFGLKVTPAGNKVFVVQYRLGGRGKTRRYTIGSYGTWTPDQARTEAKRLLRLVDQGIDPVADKQERRREAVDLAFEGYADRFLKNCVKVEWPRSHDDVARILRRHVTPVLKSKALPAVTAADVTALLDRIPARQVALRRKVYAVVSRLFSWAKGRGDVASNPLADYEAPPTPAAREHELAAHELRLAWLAAEGLGYPFRGFYRLLIGTGQRREEVAGLEWKELNRGAAEWNLPGSRSKNGEPNTVHLSAPMIAELDRIASGAKWPRKGLVFTTTGETPISGYSRAKSRLDKAMVALAAKEAEDTEEDPAEIAPWRVHDLRRTLSTGLQRLGVRFEVNEAILNHKGASKSGVAKVYQKHDWKDEKVKALDAWAAHVLALVSGAQETNVVQLAAARA